MNSLIDPLKFAKLCWPDVQFYKQQKEIIYSVVENVETHIPAGNMLGKDFVAAFIILWFFTTRDPCKILTTSVKQRHLNVLWGEMGKFIRTSRYPLLASEGGPLIVNKTTIHKVVQGRVDVETYVLQEVCNEQSSAGMGGHHVTLPSGQPIDDIPRNLFVGDEASGILDVGYEKARPCFKRMLFFGNTWNCNNFFRRAVEGNPETKDPGGDLSSPYSKGLLRKVIHIRGQDSPNVRYGQAVVDKHGLKTAMKKDLFKTILPGVLTYLEYRIRRDTYSERDQCISLDAQWPSGAEDLLFPTDWLNYSNELAEKLNAGRKATHIGVDVAQGGDNTSMAAIDALGVIAVTSKKTPNTSIIPGETIAFARYHGVPSHNVYFDLGGGGKVHLDILRDKLDFPVKGVGFGESPTPEPKMGMTMLPERKEREDTRYVYLNRRAEMYALLSMAMNPDTGNGFAIPAKFTELRRQLSPIPKLWDKEDRLFLPPKNATKKTEDEVTMRSLIGCSPDEADAVVLAVFGLKKGKMLGGGGVLF